MHKLTDMQESDAFKEALGRRVFEAACAITEQQGQAVFPWSRRPWVELDDDVKRWYIQLGQAGAGYAIEMVVAEATKALTEFDEHGRLPRSW